MRLFNTHDQCEQHLKDNTKGSFAYIVDIHKRPVLIAAKANTVYTHILCSRVQYLRQDQLDRGIAFINNPQ